MSTMSSLPVHDRTTQRRAASRRVAGAVGIAALAAVLLSVRYFTGAPSSASSFDRLPPPGATGRVHDGLPVTVPAEVNADDGPTAALHTGVDFSALQAEPDPSSRAIANYDR